jgi:tetratricopeptide (TPR) repeat protein
MVWYDLNFALIPGHSKTQVALEYAYRYQEKKSCSIFWVRGDSEASFTQNFSVVARAADLSSDLKGEDLLFAVQQWIEKQPSWLLILDNVDDLRIFKKAYSDRQGLTDQPYSPELFRFIPKAPNGTVIWTSRDKRITNKIVGINRGVEVRAMTIKESLKFFRNQTGRPLTDNPSGIEEQILDFLERLPLAIAQAAAFIRTTGVSLSKYWSMLKESEHSQSNIMDVEFDDPNRGDVPNSVMKTWLISMKQIAQENHCAEEILNIIAFFDNQGLSFELICAAAEPSFSEHEVLLAAGRLIDYSFLQAQDTVDEGSPVYQEHRLVQLATRQAFNTAQKRVFSGKALGIMAKLFPDGNYETWNACQLYLPHASKVAVLTDAEGYCNQAPVLLAHMSMYYWQQGRSEEAEKLEVEVLELRKSVLGEKHPDTILAMVNLSLTWWQQGRSEEAEKLQVEVLELQKSVLGEKHPDTISAMANLASTWWQQGRSEEAEKLEVEVLELRKSVLGEKHPNTVMAMANLAVTYQYQGRYNEAEKLQVRVLELRKSILRDKHPDTITAMKNLAATYKQQGRYGEAEKLKLEALAWKS